MAANLPRPLLDALLLKLSSDDAFRTQFRSDPRAALSQIGVRDDLDDHAAQAARCIFGKGLPSKEALAGVRVQLANSLNSVASSYSVFSPIALNEAGEAEFKAAA